MPLTHKDDNVFVSEIIENIDVFIKGEEVSKPESEMPGIVTLLSVKTKNPMTAALGLVMRIPLKVIRKSTHSYYLYQKQVNNQTDKRIKRLEDRIAKLVKEVESKNADKK